MQSEVLSLLSGEVLSLLSHFVEDMLKSYGALMGTETEAPKECAPNTLLTTGCDHDPKP